MEVVSLQHVAGLEGPQPAQELLRLARHSTSLKEDEELV